MSHINNSNKSESNSVSNFTRSTIGSSASGNTHHPVKGKPRILVIDESSDVLSDIKKYLENTGLFEIDSYNDPYLASDNFDANVYDLILMDFMMARMDHGKLHHEIEKIDSKVKMCFISGTYLNYEEARKMLPTLKKRCLIQKPINMTDLIRRIKAELRWHEGKFDT